MHPFKAGIIGTGTMGRRMMCMLQQHPNFCVAALYDPNAGMLQDAGLQIPDAKVYTDVQQLAAHPGLDLVYIASPPASHTHYIHLCFDHHLAVFCEKPLSVSLEDAAAVVNRAEKEGHIAAVNFPFASTPSLLAIVDALKKGQPFGALQSIRIHIRFRTWPRPWQQDARWLRERKEGGFLREVLSHFLFAAQRITQSELRLMSKQVTFPGDPMLCENFAEAVFHAQGIPIDISIVVEGEADDVNQLVITTENGQLRMFDWYQGDAWLHSHPFALGLPDDTRAATMQAQVNNLCKLLRGEYHPLPCGKPTRCSTISKHCLFSYSDMLHATSIQTPHTLCPLTIFV